jgi:hypothetical protein
MLLEELRLYYAFSYSWGHFIHSTGRWWVKSVLFKGNHNIPGTKSNARSDDGEPLADNFGLEQGGRKRQNRRTRRHALP